MCTLWRDSCCNWEAGTQWSVVTINQNRLSVPEAGNARTCKIRLSPLCYSPSLNPHYWEMERSSSGCENSSLYTTWVKETRFRETWMRLLNIIDREKSDNKKCVYNRKRVCDQKLLFLLKEVRNLLICRALKLKDVWPILILPW